MKLRFLFLFVGILFNAQANALQERHMIVLRHGESEDVVMKVCNSNPKHAQYKPALLTDKGREQVKKAAEQLLSHGFDNRNIKAVYVSTLPRAVETANLLAQIGVFSLDKMHLEEKLNEIKAGDKEGQPQSDFVTETWWVGDQDAHALHAESSTLLRKRMLELYDEIEKKHPDGHVLIVTHGMPSMELIDSLTKTKVKLELAQAYIVPLANRTELV
ncbi:histidine phosphatase family protein [Candidatus Berkiella aquae]|uniref:Bifunctional RNase H/acid phosphatase n=1 Tax=Candidatus Berkiella aquae TaxID=295108 RepID=A0A0Q9YJW9_9GAMM|nr:histidine phosphatase family protein [Candidatus Berkiella aquae]MCS5711357.1 histidine phosphatase family protein [Candidatus Berkiella aquae]